MRRSRLIGVGLLALAAASGACKPDLGAPISVISADRILAIRGTPAEAPPGMAVTYDLLTVNTQGRVAAPQAGWAQCHVPKAPSDPNAVSSACLTIPDDSGPSPMFMAPVPQGSTTGADGGSINVDACQHFGPDAPTDMPGVRPRDPDVTGGYYQPVRAIWHADSGDLIGFALERIRCNLANAPADITTMFNTNYKLNGNPTLASLVLDPDHTPQPLFMMGGTAPAAAATVSAGQPVILRVTWTDQTPEAYLVWNLATHSLDPHRESLSVSWFTTAGLFAHDSSGRGEQETETSTDNVWTAPTSAGTVHFWVVLRDSRGGIDFAEGAVDVGP